MEALLNVVLLLLTEVFTLVIFCCIAVSNNGSFKYNFIQI